MSTLGQRFRLGIVGAALAALVPFAVAGALAVPPAPSLEKPVVDQSGTLTAEQILTLEQQIANSRTQKDYQFALLIIKSLEGRPIEQYSLQVAREWGVGTEAKDNGVLLLVAMEDRELRIEVGRGLEGDLTDIESSRIIRNTITPKFKSGDFFSGISLGVQNIAAQVEGKPEKDTSAKDGPAMTLGAMTEAFFFLLFIGFGLFSWFVAILGRTKSWWAGGVAGGVVGLIIMAVASWALLAIVAAVVLVLGGLLLDWAVSRNYTSHVKHGGAPAWWAGGPWLGGGRGGGSGGGGGFGGGGFSGGGSSGSW